MRSPFPRRDPDPTGLADLLQRRILAGACIGGVQHSWMERREPSPFGGERTVRTCGVCGLPGGVVREDDGGGGGDTDA